MQQRRSQRLTARLTEADKAALRKKAKAAGMTMTEYLVKLIHS
jgi:uncharacterized protein (DUF1778 family)